MDSAWVAALAGVFTVLVGALGVIWAREQAAAARKHVTLETIVRYLDADVAPQMGRDIAFLWKVRRGEHSDFLDCANMTRDDFALRIQELKKSTNEKEQKLWKEIDDARRPVHKSYLRTMQLKMYSGLSDEDAIRFFTGVGLETVYEILEPIERNMVGGPYTRPVFGAYDRLFENYPNLYRKVHGTSLSVSWPPKRPWKHANTD